MKLIENNSFLVWADHIQRRWVIAPQGWWRWIFLNDADARHCHHPSQSQLRYVAAYLCQYDHSSWNWWKEILMVLREQKLLHSLSWQRLESCLQMIRSFLYAGTSQKHSAESTSSFLMFFFFIKQHAAIRYDHRSCQSLPGIAKVHKQLS